MQSGGGGPTAKGVNPLVKAKSLESKTKFPGKGPEGETKGANPLLKGKGPENKAPNPGTGPEFETKGANPLFKGKGPESKASTPLETKGANPLIKGKGPESNNPNPGKGPESETKGANPLLKGKGPETKAPTPGKGPEFETKGANPLLKAKGPESKTPNPGKGPDSENKGANPLLKAKGPESKTPNPGKGSQSEPKGANPLLKGKGPESETPTPGKGPELETKGTKPFLKGKGAMGGAELEGKAANPQFKGQGGMEQQTKGSNPSPQGKDGGKSGIGPDAVSKGIGMEAKAKNANPLVQGKGKATSGTTEADPKGGKPKSFGGTGGKNAPPLAASTTTEAFEAEAKLWEDRASRALQEGVEAEQRLQDREAERQRQEASATAEQKRHQEENQRIQDELERLRRQEAETEKSRAAADAERVQQESERLRKKHEQEEAAREIGRQREAAEAKAMQEEADRLREETERRIHEEAERTVKAQQEAERKRKAEETARIQEEVERLKREAEEEAAREKLTEDAHLFEQSKQDRLRKEAEDAAERLRMQQERDEAERNREAEEKSSKAKSADYHPTYRPRLESDSSAESLHDTSDFRGGAANFFGETSNLPLSDDLFIAPSLQQYTPMESPVHVQIWPPEPELSPMANPPILGRAAAFTWARRLETENQQLRDRLVSKEGNLITGPGDDKAEDRAGADARRRGLALLLQLGPSSVEEQPAPSSHAVVDNSAAGLARRFLQSRYPAGIGVALAEDGPEPGQDGITHMRKENKTLFVSAVHRFGVEINEKRMSIRALQAQNEVLQKRRMDADHRLEVMTEAAKGERTQREKIVNEELRLHIDEIKRLDLEAEELYQKLDQVKKRPQAVHALGKALRDLVPKYVLQDAFARWNRIRPNAGKPPKRKPNRQIGGFRVSTEERGVVPRFNARLPTPTESEAPSWVSDDWDPQKHWSEERAKKHQEEIDAALQMLRGGPAPVYTAPTPDVGDMRKAAKERRKKNKQKQMMADTLDD